MYCETCYISCNANQTPTIADWGKNDLICYGACNGVLIYDPNFGSGGKVTKSLVGHTKRVNSVKWIGGADLQSETELVSGSSDCTAIVWTLQNGNYVPFVLKGHNSNVNIVDGIYRDSNRGNTVVVSVSMDSTVKIWLRKTINDTFLLNQTLDYGYSICTALRIAHIPTSNQLLLALAPDNSNIDLLTETNELQFEKVITLKGHEDWVRGLDFKCDENGDLLLASSSQDFYIRLWRITSSKLDATTSEVNQFQANSTTYRVYVDSVLTGHEGWIYSVNWSGKSMQLLSASLDKSMIIWEVDPGANLWLEKVRLGEVGGNTLGFYGGLFAPSGDAVLAHSYHGAFHVWRQAAGAWRPQVTVGGHFGAAADLAWDPLGQFLVTVGADQTARVHAPFARRGAPTWHEIGRPQVHGYDLSALAVFARYKFASSAEEKVIRTFAAPRNFIENFRRICRIEEQDEGLDGAKGASVPSLGLSNKAVFGDCNEVESKDGYENESHFRETVLDEPPTEETLVENTLWPEVQKLYGHGYEVYALAASADGRYLASACKATTREHAAILLWDTTNWKLIQKLISHTLTIAQIAFSPDSSHILSVSRDRRWSMFRKNNQNEFELAATTDRKTSVHTRIIWCCAWSHDSEVFATGSRDGKVCVWRRNKHKNALPPTILGDYELASNHFEVENDSITALTFAPADFIVDGHDSYVVVIGLESGGILGYKWTRNEWQRLFALENGEAHHLTVKRLAFRPVLGEAGNNNSSSINPIVQLASCSSDHSVRIYNVGILK